MFEKVCNYKKIKIDSKTVDICYVEMVKESVQERNIKIKEKNREIYIDFLIDENEEKLKDVEKYQEDGFGHVYTIIKKINLIPKKFENYHKVFDEICIFLNRETSYYSNLKNYSVNIMNLNDLNHSSSPLKLSGDIHKDYQDIIRRIHLLNNSITYTSGNSSKPSLICGMNLLKYESDIKNYFDIYFNNIIDDDKVIVCRGDLNPGFGLNFLDNSEDGWYCFGETINWQKNYASFKII